MNCNYLEVTDEGTGTSVYSSTTDFQLKFYPPDDLEVILKSYIEEYFVEDEIEIISIYPKNTEKLIVWFKYKS